MDRADQEFAAADFVSNVVFDVAALRVAGCNDVLIQVADPQMGNLFVVEGDLIFSVHLFHDHVRQHVILRRGGETWPGRGFSRAMLSAAFCTSSTLIAIRRAISGKRCLPRSSMCSDTILCSRLCSFPCR